jgi:hypothetical protein
LGPIGIPPVSRRALKVLHNRSNAEVVHDPNSGGLVDEHTLALVAFGPRAKSHRKQ